MLLQGKALTSFQAAAQLLRVSKWVDIWKHLLLKYVFHGTDNYEWNFLWVQLDCSTR